MNPNTLSVIPLGGTANGPSVGKNLQDGTLVDDGQWHTAALDMRAIRKDNPDPTHLYRFQFRTNWKEDQGQQFWIDDFTILPVGTVNGEQDEGKK